MHFSERSFSWRQKRTDEVINKRPEILAPCGNPAAFRAALSAGADAMYLAMDRFGARAYAGNFQQDELLQAIEEAHLHDRKIYLTLNTLLKNEELDQLTPSLDPLYEAGLDAVLVQAFGVYRFLREHYPELSLHASTQMNLCSVEGAQYAKSLGFTRVVPARELSLNELRDIRDMAGIEVEAFVHGAMCVCYSGRCYLSSFAGGRSGNRGRCAQPCREQYGGKYPLSMKDLCTLEDVPALMKAGIDSLKIEGRMKNEYYVAACVDAYKTMVEDVLRGDFRVERAKRYRERLAEVFNRGGFTRGYLNQISGPAMLDEETPGRAGVKIGNVRKVGSGEILVHCDKDLNKGDSLEISLDKTSEPIRLTVAGTAMGGADVLLHAPKTKLLQAGLPVIRVRNASLMKELEDRFLTREMTLPVRLEVTLRAGEPFSITAMQAEDAGDSLEELLEYTATGEIPQPATGRPVSDEVLREKIGTLSGSDFTLAGLRIENDETCFIPASSIKRLRRNALEGLRRKLLERFRRSLEDATECFKKSTVSASKPDREGRIFFVSDLSMAEQLLPEAPTAMVFDFGMAVMEPERIPELKRSAKEDTLFLVGFPYIYRSIPGKEVTEWMDRLLSLAKELDGAYINGIDTLARTFYQLKGEKLPLLYLGAALYGYNDPAAEHFTELARTMADEIWMETPHELSQEELRRIRIPEDVTRIPTVYGRLPMMLTVQRMEQMEKKEKLTGARGKDLLLSPNREMCYNIVLSSRPVLQDGDGRLTAYRFTTEPKDSLQKILHTPVSELKEGIRHRGLL